MPQLYDAGPLYQWRFARQGDEAFIDACRDTELDLYAAGVKQSPMVEGQALVGNTELFLWLHWDLFKFESVDHAYYENKHSGLGDPVLGRGTKNVHRIARIYRERSSGEDVAVVYPYWQRLSTGMTDVYNLPQDCYGQWWSRDDGFHVHPTHRGKKHSLFLRLIERDLMQYHFPGVKIAGQFFYYDQYLQANHPAFVHKIVDHNTGNKDSIVSVFKSIIINREESLEPYMSRIAIPRRFNETESTIYGTDPALGREWIAVRNMYDNEKAVQRNAGRAAHYGHWADWSRDVGPRSSDGKIVWLADETKGLKPFVSRFTSDSDWINTNFA